MLKLLVVIALLAVFAVATLGGHHTVVCTPTPEHSQACVVH